VTLYPPRHHATRRDPLGLTHREREVAELLGWASVSTVAATLGIAGATVVRHRQSIYRKLHITTRNELRTRLTVLKLSEPFGEEMSAERNAFELDPRNFDKRYEAVSENMDSNQFSDAESDLRQEQ
jgi:DNA-binding CsgD family transcriptional regulator